MEIEIINIYYMFIKLLLIICFTVLLNILTSILFNQYRTQIYIFYYYIKMHQEFVQLP